VWLWNDGIETGMAPTTPSGLDRPSATIDGGGEAENRKGVKRCGRTVKCSSEGMKLRNGSITDAWRMFQFER
jgi:hypothetical protein